MELYTVPTSLLAFLSALTYFYMFSFQWKDSPKSMSFIVSELGDKNKKFSGFRSRWQIFWVWQWLTASIICLNNILAEASENIPFESILSKSYPPVHKLLLSWISTQWRCKRCCCPRTSNKLGWCWGDQAPSWFKLG